MTSVAVVAHRDKRLGGGLSELRQTLIARGVTDPLWFEVPKSAKAPKRVRRAVKHAINREQVMRFVLQGHGVVAQDTPVAPSSAFHADVKAPAFDVAKARELMKEAGVASGFEVRLFASNERANCIETAQVIKPMLDGPGVELIGEINETQKPDFLSGAIALLMPVDWPEPFGLVMIEAMACGTPVIAFNRGSVPEVIDDGISGFVVEDETGAVGAVERLNRLNRNRVREQFDARFTGRRMAEDYLTLYRWLAALEARQHLRVIA